MHVEVVLLLLLIVKLLLLFLLLLLEKMLSVLFVVLSGEMAELMTRCEEFPLLALGPRPVVVAPVPIVLLLSILSPVPKLSVRVSLLVVDASFSIDVLGLPSLPSSVRRSDDLIFSLIVDGRVLRVDSSS